MHPLRLLPLLIVLLTGCGSTVRAVRLDTGSGSPIVFTPRSSPKPVEVDADAYAKAVEAVAHFVRPSPHPQEAARRLFEVGPRSGSYLYDPHSRRVTPMDPGEHLESELLPVDVELTRAYLRWCERTARPGDCLRLLVEGPTVTGDGRYALTMALAQGVVLEEMMDAFQDMADPEAMLTSVLWTWTTYMILLAVPEPFSKGIAAAMTLTLIAYVGVDTFWNLIVGFKRLVVAADRATTFDELRTEGERYGKVMGRNAARAFAMLAMAAIGNSAAGMARQVPTLPGAAQAMVQAESQMGVRFAAMEGVEAVAISADAVTLSLAPGAVAMSAGGNSAMALPTGSRAWGSFSGFKKAMGPAGTGKEWHHIVEQTPGNVNRFGAQAVHNTENIVPLDKSLHLRLSGLYSSIRRVITASGNLTVRQWLSTQPFEAQREFGLLAIENVTKGIW
ncbi:MAG: hypothetical protein EOO70_04290 [Myxococcaceae bacterium]|nr:MAG: hypothetical protein EOO70_04290 [Myxococcaceae bacterium]